MSLFWYPDRANKDLNGPVDKEALMHHYIMTTLSRLQSMFKYDGLPDTIPQRWLENYLMCNGSCVFIKDGEDLIVTTGGWGGLPDRYYVPTQYIVANPYVKEETRKTYTIDEDCVLIRNDAYARGLLGIIESHARLLTENYITMDISTVLARAMLTITATNSNDKQSVDLWLKKLIDGELSAIGELPAMVGNQDRSINITPFQSVAGMLTDLIEERQYIKASLFNELGLNANYNMKRESINSNESQLNDDMLHPLIDEMLKCRKEALEKVNAMFGTDISVELASAWKDNETENELAMEVMEAEAQTASEVSNETDNIEAAPGNDEVLIDETENEDITDEEVSEEAEVTEDITDESDILPEVEAVEALTEAVEDLTEAIAGPDQTEDKEGEENV